MQVKAIGIDLGTTNSAAAFCEPGRRDARILPTSQGDNLTPSVVSFKASKLDPKAGEILVGRPALNNAQKAPEDTIFSIKRLMGRTFQEEKVAQVREKFNYQVIQAPGDNPGVCVRLGGKQVTPVEVSAHILRRIKEDASKALGAEVTHAVITVPAYFEERQRMATWEAGRQAGFVVKKIIDEPTAAAIAFGVQVAPGGRHRILVYDLGGGTFDISILQMVNDAQGRGQFQVLQIEGDNWLGGDDFDRLIVDRIVADLVKESGGELPEDRRFLLLAKQHAEQAKRALSAAREAEVVIPAAVRSRAGGVLDVELTLTRAEFETMIRGHVERSIELVRKALKDQALTPEDITDVLLVGGSTLVPLVVEAVQAVFGANKVRRTVNPMECVALGASILAASLTGVECPHCKAVNDELAPECVKCKGSLANARAVGDTNVTEVTPQSLGIAVVKGSQSDVFAPIIPKGTPYPLREPMKKSFLAPAAGRRIRVPVYEGDLPVASRNEEQGVLEYELPTDVPPTTPVEVSFNYDRNRTLSVTVRVQGTAFQKTETLRRDQPRTAPPPPQRPEEEEDWQAELDDTVAFVQRFREKYGAYMDVTQQRKIDTDLARAQKALGDEKEGRRMTRLLQMHVFNSGVASQLFLAERAQDAGPPPDISQRLGQGIMELRQAHDMGDAARVQQLSGVLRVLVAQTLERRAGVKEVADQQDFGGLLRLLGEQAST
jgi:molecular chaperone DnaK